MKGQTSRRFLGSWLSLVVSSLAVSSSLPRLALVTKFLRHPEPVVMDHFPSNTYLCLFPLAPSQMKRRCHMTFATHAMTEPSKSCHVTCHRAQRRNKRPFIVMCIKQSLGERLVANAQNVESMPSNSTKAFKRGEITNNLDAFRNSQASTFLIDSNLIDSTYRVDEDLTFLMKVSSRINVVRVSSSPQSDFAHPS